MNITRRALAGSAAGSLVLLRALPVEAAEAPALRKELAWLSRFVGKWAGEGDGEPGHSTVERFYEPSWGGTFLLARNQSTYALQPKNPKGEVHHDMGLYSFDANRKMVVLRQFNQEGFVNQYIAPAASLTGDKVPFDTEAIENIPPGFKARETYTFSGPDAFEEVFEIAEPGKAYAVYSHNRLKRV